MLLLKFDAYPEKWWIFAFFVPFDMHPPVVAARCPRLPPPSPPQPWYIQHGNCSHSLQSLNNVLESQIFSLTGRTFLFNLLFLVIQSIHFTTSPCVPAAGGGWGGLWWLLTLHGESVCPKMGTDFIPKSEIINKCVAYRPDISLMSHLEYNQFPFLDTRTHHALVQSHYRL